jgi:hypothetical protein
MQLTCHLVQFKPADFAHTQRCDLLGGQQYVNNTVVLCTAAAQLPIEDITYGLFAFPDRGSNINSVSQYTSHVNCCSSNLKIPLTNIAGSSLPGCPTLQFAAQYCNHHRILCQASLHKPSDPTCFVYHLMQCKAEDFSHKHRISSASAVNSAMMCCSVAVLQPLQNIQQSLVAASV